MIFIAGCQHIGVKARSHENDESRGPVHVSSLWQREENGYGTKERERDREKGSCKQRLSHENYGQRKGNLKRRKEKDC
jgi:hypothetical protein